MSARGKMEPEVSGEVASSRGGDEKAEPAEPAAPDQLASDEKPPLQRATDEKPAAAVALMPSPRPLASPRPAQSPLRSPSWTVARSPQLRRPASTLAPPPTPPHAWLPRSGRRGGGQPTVEGQWVNDAGDTIRVVGSSGVIENAGTGRKETFRIAKGGILHLGGETWVLATGSAEQLIWRSLEEPAVVAWVRSADSHCV